MNNMDVETAKELDRHSRFSNNTRKTCGMIEKHVLTFVDLEKAFDSLH